MVEKEFMTVQEAAIYLGKPDSTIRMAVSRGLPTYKKEEYGRKPLAVSDLNHYADTARVGRPRKEDNQQSPSA